MKPPRQILLVRLKCYQENQTSFLWVLLPALPVHDVKMDNFVSKKGMEYVKCPYIDCLLFTLKHDVNTYEKKAVHRLLHTEMKQRWMRLIYFWSRPMRLRVSHSEKTLVRIYLGCNI